MTAEHAESRLAALLRALTPKAKQPVSATVLNNWIAQAEGKLGDEAKGGRLGWLVASSVAIAAVQRAIDVDGRHLFLLKGGTLLQHRLNATARTTKDVVDLLLLRDRGAGTGSPTVAEIRAAGVAVFDARVQESGQLGLTSRHWPQTVIGHPHWADDSVRAAGSAGIDSSLAEVVAEANAWIATIDRA